MNASNIRASQTISKAEPYHYIAKIYDRLMSHVNYQIWADYIENCFQRFSRNVQCILDGGCGTGSLVREFSKRGYLAAGFDLSYPMIDMARSKGLQMVWQGDLCQPATKNRWDACLCLYDTIHYLHKDKVSQVFHRLFNLLRVHGILVFDVVTEHHVKHQWANYSEQGQENAFSYMRRCWYHPREQCQHTEFHIYTDNQKNVLYEHHKQWIYPVSFFIEQAVASGFEYCGQFDNFTFNPGNKRSERIHIVLCRRES